VIYFTAEMQRAQRIFWFFSAISAPLRLFSENL